MMEGDSMNAIRQLVRGVFVVFVATGAPKVRARLGKALLGHQYRLCEGSKREPVTALLVVPPPSEPSFDAEEMLLDSQFKFAYYRALGPKIKERWLAKLDGLSRPAK